MLRLIALGFLALSVFACGSASDKPSVNTRPFNEVWLGYNCPDGTEVRISDSGFTVGTDPELHPEVNTSDDWSVESLMNAAC